ncbi:MAG: O-antigen ligase family protein [Oleispira sp.]
MFRFKLGGGIIRIADFVAVAVILSALVLFPVSRRQLINVRMLPIYGLAGFICLQSLFFENYLNSLKEIIQLLFVGVFLSINMWLMSFNRKKYIDWLLFFLCISIIYTVLFHVLSGQFFRYKLAGDGKYAFGLFTVLAFLNWKITDDKKYKLYFIFSLLPLVLSLERKGMFGFLLVLVSYAGFIFLEYLRIKSKHLLLLLGCILVLLFLIFLGDINNLIDNKLYMENFLDESIAIYTSNIHRESLLINGWSIFSENTAFGIGADNIRREMGQFYLDSNLAGGTHNFYLDSLIKYGVVGAVFLITLQFLVLKHEVNKVAGVFVLYCLFVAAFMSDGQAVLLLYMLPVFSCHVMFGNERI